MARLLSILEDGTHKTEPETAWLTETEEMDPVPKDKRKAKGKRAAKKTRNHKPNRLQQNMMNPKEPKLCPQKNWKLKNGKSLQNQKR